MDDAAFAGRGDTALVSAMVRRDPVGFEGAYRRYADRLYAYCRSLLGDPEAAADVVHDTFIVASRQVTQLREPERLRAWLYAIARRECLRQLRSRARVGPMPDEAQLRADQTDPAGAAQSDLVRELVRAAAGGLNDSDRDIIQLTLRHGLGPADIAATLGVSTNHAHARLSRARAQLADCLGALLVARGAVAGGAVAGGAVAGGAVAGGAVAGGAVAGGATAAGGEPGQRRCADLAKMLHGWDGRLTPLLRKRLHRHISSCALCSAQRAQRFNPAALLAGYAALPFLAVADTTWPRLDRTLSDPASQMAILERPGRFDPKTGFPVRTSLATRAPVRWAAATAAGVILVLLGAVAGIALLGPDGPPNDPTNAAPGPSEPGLANPSPLTQPPPSPGQTSTRPPPGTASSTGPAPLGLTAVAIARCGSGAVQSYLLAVEARLSDGTIETATLHYTTPLRRRTAMTVDGSTATATVNQLTAARVTWWVRVTATDGRAGQTANRRLDNPC